MSQMLKCDICGKVYEWHNGVYRDAKLDAMGTRERLKYLDEHKNDIGAGANMPFNCIKLGVADPYYTGDQANKVHTRNGDGDEIYGNTFWFDLCQDCMRDLLDKLHHDGASYWDLY